MEQYRDHDMNRSLQRILQVTGEAWIADWKLPIEERPTERALDRVGCDEAAREEMRG